MLDTEWGGLLKDLVGLGFGLESLGFLWALFRASLLNGACLGETNMGDPLRRAWVLTQMKEWATRVCRYEVIRQSCHKKNGVQQSQERDGNRLC